jgi:outer membrane protein assembly factor BamD
MKHLKYLFILSLFYMGCSSSIETANLDADERLKYAMELFNDETYDLAIAEFEAIILQFPGNEVVDDAQFYLAKCRFARKEYILAASEFSRLIKNMAASSFVSESQFMLATCYYQLSPPYSLDQRYTKKAIEEYQAFIDFFPTDERVQDAEKNINELNEKLALKVFNSAIIYEKLEYYNAAVSYYNNILEIYHDTQYAPMASYNKIKVLLLKNKKSEAEKEMDNFLIKYPSDPNYNEVQQMKEQSQSESDTATK